MSAEIQMGWNNGKLQAGAAGAAAIVNKAATQMKGALSNVSSGLGAGLGITPFLGVTAAVTGAVVAVGALNEAYDHIWDVSQRLNESPESIQRIGLMAKLAGTDLDATAKAIQKMNLELRKGSDSEGVKALKMMGVDAADLIKLSPEKQIAALAAAFQRAQASGVGFVELQTLLGKKFSDLLPLLRSSTEELDAMSKVKAVSDEDVAAIAKANDEWDKLKYTVGTGVTGALVGAFNYLQRVNSAIDATDTSLGNSLNVWGSFSDQLKIAADLQEKDAKASQMLSEKLRQQQRDLEAITAAQSSANAQADESIKKSKEQAAAIDKVSKSYEEQAKKAQAASDDLRNAQDQTRGEYTTPEQKLTDAKERHLELAKQIDALSGDDNSGQRAALLKQQEGEMRLIMQLGKEILATQERTNEEAAKEAERIAGVRSEHEANLYTLNKELAIIEATASGHDKKAAALQRELDIQERALQIVEQTGLAYADAGAIATRMIDAKEKADNRSKDGGRSKIYGYSQEQGGTGEARTRAEGRMKDSRKAYTDSISEHMGMGGMSASRLTPRSDGVGARTPATDAVKPSGDSELALAFTKHSDRVVEVLEKALA